MLGTFPASVKQMAKQNSSSTESCAMSCALAWLVCTKSNFSCAGRSEFLQQYWQMKLKHSGHLNSWSICLSNICRILPKPLKPLKPLKPRMGPWGRHRISGASGARSWAWSCTQISWPWPCALRGCCAPAAAWSTDPWHILGASLVHRVFAGSLAVGEMGAKHGKAGKGDSLVREVATHGLTV